MLLYLLSYIAMKYWLFKLIVIALAIGAIACTDDALSSLNTPTEMGSLPNLTASIEDGKTRTYIDNELYLRWHAEDNIVAFFGNTLNRQYQFTGQTGDNSGTFKHIPSTQLGTGNIIDQIYAVYPYDDSIRITEGGVMRLTLPAEQYYAENSFGRNANTMVAVTENTEDTFLNFRNVCGYLKLKLYQEEAPKVKRISVEGNAGEKIAGHATVAIAYGEAPIVTMAEDATSVVSLNCGEGVGIGESAESPVEFWLTIPETTFESGISLTVENVDGNIFRISTTKPLTITRNHIQPMAALEVKFNVQADNEIWYTSSDETVITPYKTDVFGANIVSNTYENGKGVILFDGPVTSIGDRAFYNKSKLTSISLPYGVSTIGECAFQFCTRLVSITIPNSVTQIGRSAFSYCSKLEEITIPESVTKMGWNIFGGCTSLKEFKGKGAQLDGLCLVWNDYLMGYASNSNVKEFTIPSGVTGICDECFRESSIEVLTLPSTIKSFTSLGSFKQLKKIICHATTPPGINASPWFTNNKTSSFKGLFVPAKSLAKYKAAYGWKNYSLYGFYDETHRPSQISSKKITYKATSKLEPYSYNFGTNVNIVDNIYDEATGKGEITFDADLESLYYNFYDCDNLVEIVIPEGVTSILQSAFEQCSNLVSITLPSTLTEIGYYVFRLCGSLKSITLPSTLTEIGTEAFRHCKSLETITIPDNVTKINTSSFNYCSSLVHLTVGSGVTSFDDDLYGCSSLKTMYFKSTTPPTLPATYNFTRYCTSLETIYVPKGCGSRYRSTTSWSNFTIVEYDGTSPAPWENEVGDGSSSSYSVNLNNNWRKSTTIANPDSSLYDGVYESFSNYHVGARIAKMQINIRGYDNFKLYIRSDAESTFDYVMVSQLDATIDSNTAADSPLVKAHTHNNQQSGTEISNYTLVEFTGIDQGNHTITIIYRKDAATNEGNDRGYILIPKQQ